LLDKNYLFKLYRLSNDDVNVNIVQNTQDDQKLWRLNFFRKEKMQVRIHTWQGNILKSKIYTGTKGQVGTFDSIAQLIEYQLYKARQKKLHITAIEIVHTHPLHTLDKDSWYLGELSHQDRLCAKYLKSLYPYPIVMKIVGPCNFAMVWHF
jgi:hypothetical protein